MNVLLQPTYGSSIVDRVRTGLAMSLSGASLIRELKGTHPIEIKSTLLSQGAHDLVHAAFESLAARTPAVVEIERDDNPILSFWPFTSSTASKLASMAEASASVALLGTPTLFAAMKTYGHHGITLFERDSYFFDPNAGRNFFQCDVSTEISTTFNDHFDLVVADPPWYLNDYRHWLRAAARIGKPGGRIMFVMFPDFIRETAHDEKQELLTLANELFSRVSLQEGAVEYETPSFEKVQLIRSGIRPFDWRRAGLLTGQVKHKKNLLSPFPSRTRPAEWTERRIGCGRIFVRLDRNSEDTDFLSTAETNSRFLLSPSHRNPARVRANVISSRGHGLHCSDPGAFLALINGIRTPSDIAVEAKELARSSRELFEKTCSELWSRYLEIE